MANKNSKLFASQSYTSWDNAPERLKEVSNAKAHYVIDGTETPGDVIRLAKLPGGTRVLPQSSTISVDDGVALTLKLGTDTYTASFNTGADLGTAGQYTFVSTGSAGSEVTVPVDYSDEYVVQAVVTNTGSLTTGADALFEIKFEA